VPIAPLAKAVWYTKYQMSMGMVKDRILAHGRSLAPPPDRKPTAAVSSTWGHPVFVRQVIADVERVLAIEVPTVEASRRSGDPPRLFAAPGHAGRDLGCDIVRIVEKATGWRRWA
jgi:UDP-glucose 4-epimerase